MTLPFSIVDLKVDTFDRTIYSSILTVIAFTDAKLWMVGGRPV